MIEVAAIDSMTFEEFVAWNQARRRAEGRILKPGEGYQERIATLPTSEPARLLHASRGFLDRRCAVVQENVAILMDERAIEIEEGLIHETPAMTNSRMKIEAAIRRQAREVAEMQQIMLDPTIPIGA